MKILAIELSTARASLTWLDATMDGKSSSTDPRTISWPNDRKDSGPFFQNLEETVHKFGLPEKIVVGLGPGSYAGVRIAISTAIGLRAAAKAELLGYPSVCIMPESDGSYAVIGDARRQSFFFVRIRDRSVVGSYDLLPEADLKHRIDGLNRGITLFSSDLLPQFQPRVEQRYPSAELLAQLAAQPGREFVRPPLEPIYLRAPHVTIPKTPILGRLSQ